MSSVDCCHGENWWKLLLCLFIFRLLGPSPTSQQEALTMRRLTEAIRKRAHSTWYIYVLCTHYKHYIMLIGLMYAFMCSVWVRCPMLQALWRHLWWPRAALSNRKCSLPPSATSWTMEWTARSFFGKVWSKLFCRSYITHIDHFICFKNSGPDANTEERKTAMKVAEQFIKDKNYPKNSQVSDLDPAC